MKLKLHMWSLFMFFKISYFKLIDINISKKEMKEGRERERDGKKRKKERGAGGGGGEGKRMREKKTKKREKHTKKEKIKETHGLKKEKSKPLKDCLRNKY